MECSILDVIEQAQENGFYSFVVKRHAVPLNAAGHGGNILRELLRAHFCTFTTCTLKTGTVFRWTDGLDATASVSPRGDWTVSLNLAKFFRLPAISPRAELDELKAFLEAMKPFFEAHVQSRTVVDFFSSSASGSPSARVECRYPIILGLASVIDDSHTSRLRALVDGSPVLQAFLANLELAGRSAGPWDFAQIHETMLYGLEDGPAMRQFIEEQRVQVSFFERHDSYVSPLAA